MLRYGGGGHLAAGTCQVPHEDSERVRAEIVDALKTPRDGPRLRHAKRGGRPNLPPLSAAGRGSCPGPHPPVVFRAPRAFHDTPAPTCAGRSRLSLRLVPVAPRGDPGARPRPPAPSPPAPPAGRLVLAAGIRARSGAGGAAPARSRRATASAAATQPSDRPHARTRCRPEPRSGRSDPRPGPGPCSCRWRHRARRARHRRRRPGRASAASVSHRPAASPDRPYRSRTSGVTVNVHRARAWAAARATTSDRPAAPGASALARHRDPGDRVGRLGHRGAAVDRVQGRVQLLLADLGRPVVGTDSG